MVNMAEVVNETSETNESTVSPVVEKVESEAAKAPEVAKPAKAKKKPAKDAETSDPIVESKEMPSSPSPRKSIYWPSVRSFMGRETVAEVVKSACERVGVVEPRECEKSESSFGSMRDVLESVAMLDASNVDQDDLDGLAECLFVMAK